MNSLFKKGVLYSVILLLFQVQGALAQTGYIVPESRDQLTLSYAPLVKQVAPAVVNIYASKRVTVAGSPFAGNPLFEHFFGNNPAFNHQFSPFAKPRQKRIVNSLGSGVVVDPSGLIITNNHVVSAGDEIKVILADKREFDAQVVMVDKQTDLALIKVQTSGELLPSVRFGDPDAMQVGDLVLAIGNPFGIGQTVTSGIVSALARTTVGISDFEFFIQTDAAINPGNSGGALVNMAGELVGINTAIFSKTGSSNGIGFATPSIMARLLIGSYQRGYGRVIRPWVGASTQDVTADLAGSFGLKRPSGVIINKVFPSSAADRAGLQPGDVVVSVDGQEVLDENALKFRVATKPIGGTAQLKVIREGKTRYVTLEMEAPDENTPRNDVLLQGSHPLAGAVVTDLSPAAAYQLGVDEIRGVMVLSVDGRGHAARFFREGDMLETVNGVPITSVAQLQQLLATPGRGWKISANRNGKRIMINLIQ